MFWLERCNTSHSEASLDSLQLKGFSSRARVVCEKVELIDVVIATSDEVAHEGTVRALKRSEIPKIKRL